MPPPFIYRVDEIREYPGIAPIATTSGHWLPSTVGGYYTHGHGFRKFTDGSAECVGNSTIDDKASSPNNRVDPYGMDLDETDSDHYSNMEPIKASRAVYSQLVVTSDRGHEEEFSTIKCVCGFSDDDGNTVLCEKCDTWQHIVCYYESAEHVPDVHECTDCSFRIVDATRAADLQRRQRLWLAEGKGRTKMTATNPERRAEDNPSASRPHIGKIATDHVHIERATRPYLQSRPEQSEHSRISRQPSDDRSGFRRHVGLIGHRTQEGKVRYTISQDNTVCQIQQRRVQLVALRRENRGSQKRGALFTVDTDRNSPPRGLPNFTKRPEDTEERKNRLLLSTFESPRSEMPFKVMVPGPPQSRKRGRAAPPGRCHSCNRAETPEWRRGPDGARTLCNACGLHYEKLTRKMGGKAMARSDLQPKSLDQDRPQKDWTPL